MEGDEFLHTIPAFCGHFNPLPPHGGRLRCFQNILLMFTFQSTPSAWRETLFRKTILQASSFQSTPSAWRETSGIGRNAVNFGISIHSLRMEGDPIADNTFNVLETFQSTPSAWRETRLISCNSGVVSHFNPLPPHGGRPTN